jgi:hypothetical protein
MKRVPANRTHPVPWIWLVALVIVIGFGACFLPGALGPSNGPGTDPGTSLDMEDNLVLNGTAGGHMVEGALWLPVMGVNNSFNLTVRITSSVSAVSTAYLYLQPVGAANYTYVAIQLTLQSGDSHDGWYKADVPQQSGPGFIYYYFTASNGSTTARCPDSGRFWMQIVPGETPSSPGPASMRPTTRRGMVCWSSGGSRDLGS